MSKEYVSKIAEELNLKTKQIQATAALLDEGATVPFIARYRKEATGTLAVDIKRKRISLSMKSK